MRRVAIVIMMLIVLGVASVAQATPVAYLDDSEPGLGVNFNNGTSDMMAWGAKNYWSDGSWPGLVGYPDWDYTGGKAEPNLESSLGPVYGRLLTTLKDEDVGAYPTVGTPMSAGTDWIASMLWTNNTTDSTARMFEMAARQTASNYDIAKFYGTGSGNTFKLDGGNGTNSYVTLWTGSLSTGVERKLTLHYKASNSRLDFYIDDTLVAADFPARRAVYNLYRVNYGSWTVTGDVLDDLMVGVPEPMTLGFLAVSGVFVLLRRRKA